MGPQAGGRRRGAANQGPGGRGQHRDRSGAGGTPLAGGEAAGSPAEHARPGGSSVLTGLRADVVATVRVPATSANLGPGFDSLGLALAIHDVVRLRLAPSGFEVDVHGEGAEGVPLTEKHLV